MTDHPPCPRCGERRGPRVCGGQGVYYECWNCGNHYTGFESLEKYHHAALVALVSEQNEQLTRDRDRWKKAAIAACRRLAHAEHLLLDEDRGISGLGQYGYAPSECRYHHNTRPRECK